MAEFDAAGLVRAATSAAGDNSQISACAAAQALLDELEHNTDPQAAVRRVFASLMTATSQDYFAQDWAPGHEFFVWARLADDRRAWGYGNQNEIAALRWLVDATGCWFDGNQLLTLEQWRPRFEEWAEMQYRLVRRMTPGALEDNPFPSSMSGI